MLTSDSNSSHNKSRHADVLDRSPVRFGVNVCSWHEAEDQLRTNNSLSDFFAHLSK